MVIKSTIILCFAAMLSAASLPLATHAFAEKSSLAGSAYANSAQGEKMQGAHTSRYGKGKAMGGEQPRQPEAAVRWVDDPAAPGG
jgi:hypothetical protein